MSDTSKPGDSSAASTSSFTSYFSGFFGSKTSLAGSDNADATSSADGGWTYGLFGRRGSKDDDSIKRNETWAGFAETRSLTPNPEQLSATGSKDSALVKAARSANSTPVRERVTWSFFNRNSSIVDEGKSVPNLDSAQPSAATKEGDAVTRMGTVPQPDGKLPLSRRRCHTGLYIMDENFVKSEYRDLNLFMPIST